MTLEAYLYMPQVAYLGQELGYRHAQQGPQTPSPSYPLRRVLPWAINLPRPGFDGPNEQTWLPLNDELRPSPDRSRARSSLPAPVGWVT